VKKLKSPWVQLYFRPSHRRVGTVVHGERIDVRDRLVKPPLAGPDFPDALQQLVEMFFAKDLLSRNDSVEKEPPFGK
jgi:hypothetical protein